MKVENLYGINSRNSVTGIYTGFVYNGILIWQYINSHSTEYTALISKMAKDGWLEGLQAWILQNKIAILDETISYDSKITVRQMARLKIKEAELKCRKNKN